MLKHYQRSMRPLRVGTNCAHQVAHQGAPPDGLAAASRRQARR